MKSKIYFITSLLALVSLLFLNSCKEETKSPIITLSPEIVQVPFKGGDFSVSYTIENPASGAQIAVQCDADWITDFNLETYGKISFTVAKNGFEGAREAVVEVNYPGVIPLPTFTVKQEIGELPTIEFSPDTVKVDFKGGVQTVAYQIENPIEGAEITVDCKADWITDFNTETEGQISFKVAKNGIEGPRETAVKVNYPAIDPAPEFTVMQEIGVVEFEIEVSNVTYSSMTISVIPYDKEMKYMSMISETSDLTNLSDDDIFANDLNYFQQFADAQGISINEILDEFSTNDDITEDISGFIPGTSYTIYVYGIDVNEADRLTDIYKQDVTTEAVPMIEAKFDIDPQVDGPTAYINYTPVGYDGYYYPIALGGYDESATEKDLSEAIISDWLNFSNDLRLYLNYTDEQILQEICSTGTDTIIEDLDETTLYVALAAAVNDEIMMICSEPSYKFFTTGEVHPSDNIITISVDSLKSWKAKIILTPSNNDPYTATLLPTEIIEKNELSDEDIIEIMLEYPGYVHGEYSETVKSLESNTEYIVFAIGCAAGKATTELFKYTFTTPEPVLSNVKVKIEYNNWADGMAIAGLDPDYAAREPQEGLAFLAIDFSADPAGIPVYYGLYPAYAFEDPDSSIIHDIMMDMLYYKPSKLPYEVWMVQYGDEVVGCAIGEDANGDLGELYIGDPVTFTEEGVMNPEEWLAKYPYLVSEATQAHITRASKFNEVQPNTLLLRKVNIHKHAAKKHYKVSNEKQVIRKVSINIDKDEIMRKNGMIVNRVIKMRK